MKNIFFSMITTALVGVDLWCKSYVEKHFLETDKKSVCGGKVELRKCHNKGMAMSIGEKNPERVRVVTIVCGMLYSLYVIFVGAKEACSWKKLGASMVLAGAISNTYDRIKRNYVVDYFGFKTKWKKFNRLTFNLADMFLFAGSFLLLMEEIVGCIRKK